MAQAGNIYYDWIHKARSLQTEQTIYIQCENKGVQKTFHKNLKKELEILSNVDPIEASSLSITTIFKDSRHWVCIKRTAANPYIGFVKSPDGSISRVSIEQDEDRLRRLSLMVSDGWSQLQIEEAERTPLTHDEISTLWPNTKRSAV